MSPDYAPFYDRQGRPLSFEQWAALMPDDRAAWEQARRVALDHVGPYLVSTVWIGMPLNLGMSGPPLIFETMVFAAEEPLDELTVRYSTEELAQSGHQSTVTLVRTELDLSAPEPADASQGPTEGLS